MVTLSIQSDITIIRLSLGTARTYTPFYLMSSGVLLKAMVPLIHLTRSYVFTID